MSKNRKNLRQRGAALVIGLILLAIITLLAVVGMNISNSELASASSEQVRLRASQASETGIEYGMLEMFKPTAKTTCGWYTTPPVTPIAGSPINSATGLPTDHYATRVSYVDQSQIVDGYSSSAFASYHYLIESHGDSSRNAVSKQVQGAYLVNQSAGGQSWKPTGTDCYVPITSGF
jgi:Tfp pilus assembly protein PilX